jgi:hypothetical protein
MTRYRHCSPTIHKAPGTAVQTPTTHLLTPHQTMAHSSQNVIVFGATGTIGKFLIGAIIDAKASFKRIAIFTSPNTVETKKEFIDKLKASGVEIIVGNVRDEKDVSKAYEGFDTVVSAVGRPVILDQILLLQVAETIPNIKRFFPSEYGTDIEFGPKSPNEKPHQLKLKVRAYIRDKVKRVEHTYLVTGPYANSIIGSSRGDPRGGGFDVKEKKATLLGSGDDKIALMTCSEYVGQFKLTEGRSD